MVPYILAAETAQRKLITYSGKKGDIVNLRKDSEIKHTDQKNTTDQFSKKEISEMRKNKLAEIKSAKCIMPTFKSLTKNMDFTNSQQDKEKKEKEKKKEAKKKRIINKKKKNYNYIYIKEQINQNTSYSSSLCPLMRSGNPDQVGVTNNMSLEQRRKTLKNQKLYRQKHNESIVEEKPRITKNVQRMFNLWDELAGKINILSPMSKKLKTGKKFKQSCSLCNAFFKGTLPNNKLTILPEYHKLKLNEPIKQTLSNFKKYLHWFELQLLDSSYKSLIFTKVDLNLFLAGDEYLSIPSILFTWCWKEPKRIITFNYEEYFPLLIDGWEEAGGYGTFTTKDLQNFDIYFAWALPHFQALRKDFNSLKSFEDHLDILEFFTLGVLRKFKDKGKSFSTGILNQEFFKNMMEDLRKYHGYTV